MPTKALKQTAPDEAELVARARAKDASAGA
jgi:hypothetical protein